MKLSRPLALGLSSLLIGLLSSTAQALSPDDAKGLWLSAEKDGVIEFKPCANKPAALCGHIVWDKDAGAPGDTCGLQIAQLERFEKDGWRDGWLYDPRDKKKYKGVLRVKDGELHLRAYIGSEILGQTEQMTRVDTLPTSPSCKKS